MTIPISLPIEFLMAFAATALMGRACVRPALACPFCVCLCVFIGIVCFMTAATPRFTASLNPIQSKARAAAEGEERVDVC